MNIIDELSAFIELQAEGSLFSSIIKLACSGAPNPFETFDFLGGQKVRSVTFAGSGDTILTATQFATQIGQVALSFPVTINSIDLNEFIQSPNSPGTTTQAAYIVTVGIAGLSLVAAVARIDVGTDQHALPTPVVLVTQSFEQQLGPLGGSGLVKGGAVLFDPANVVVVLRLATTDLSLAEVNVWPVAARMFTSTFPGAWATFLSGGALAAFTTALLKSQLTGSLPSNIITSSQPQADWTAHGPIWGIDASVGLDAVDGCPSVFGDVDVHVTLHPWITVTTNVANRQISLRVHVTHDTNQWDVFACTMANIAGGLLLVGTSSADAAVGTFFAGPGLVFTAAVLLPGTIYGTVSELITNQQLSAFTKVTPPDDGDDATFTQAQCMPLLYPTTAVAPACPPVPPGDSLDASVDQSGVTIRGTWKGLFPVPGTHAMQVSGDPVESDWESHFNCSTHLVDKGQFDMSPIGVKDIFTAPGIGSQPTPVKIFSVLAVAQGDWNVLVEPGSFAKAQTVQVSPQVDPTAHPGLTGKIYIHSSAGLAAVNIAPLAPAPAQLTGLAWAKAVADCQEATPAGPWGSGLFNLHWLVDPAPWEAAGIMQDWAISLSAFGSDTSAVIQHVSGGVATSRSFAGTNQQMMIRLVIPSADQLRLSVQGPGKINGSIGQRLLVVTNTFRLSEPIRQLVATDGGNFAVLTASKLVTMSVDRGVTSTMDNLGGANLTNTAQGTLLTGPGGTFRVTPVGLLPLAATLPGTAQMVARSGSALIATVLSAVRVPAAAATQPLGSLFLRLNGRQVLVADGSNLVVTRPSRFTIGVSNGSTPA